MSDFYRENILEHYKHPRNYGTLQNANAVANDSNPLCGDRMTFELNCTDDGVIADIAFTAEGCALSISSASLLSEHIKGKDVAELQRLDHDSMQELLEIEVGAGRIKCVLLPLSTLRKAIINLQKHHG